MTGTSVDPLWRGTHRCGGSAWPGEIERHRCRSVCRQVTIRFSSETFGKVTGTPTAPGVSTGHRAAGADILLNGDFRRGDRHSNGACGKCRSPYAGSRRERA